MNDHKDRQKEWLAIALLVGVFLILVFSRGCPKSEAYRGSYALTDSVTFVGALTDTSGTVGATPSAFEAFFYKNGTLFDSTTTVVHARPGEWKVRHLASDGSTYGDYQAIFRMTVQGYAFVVSDAWQVDSLLAGHFGATGWAAITAADCDTVKISGVPQADVTVIVTLNSDRTTPLYMDRTDANGCYTVYVPTGATYAVRPIKQGAWLAAWCTVAK